MTRDVKARRDYDSSGRQAKARQARQAVLEAAHTRFVEHGYAATTMAEVAADARVSVETVYKAFGSKAGLVKAVLDVSIVGDDDPIALMERDSIQRIRAEPDPRRKLRAYAAHLVATAPRTFPVQFVVREAAAADPAAAGVWEQLQAERLTGMTHLAGELHAGGHLRSGVSTDEARDVLWTHNSVELWHLLVIQRGWDTQRYGVWIGEQLIAALL
jgi:AcrR family transcriptional regulator